MSISGNVNSMSMGIERARIGDAMVKPLPIASSATGIWPVGLIVVKADEDSDYEPWAAPATPAQGADPDPYVTGILAVVDEETDTAQGIANLLVFGGVQKGLLKVGATDSEAPDDEMLFELQQRHIYAV